MSALLWTALALGLPCLVGVLIDFSERRRLRRWEATAEAVEQDDFQRWEVELDSPVVS